MSSKSEYKVVLFRQTEQGYDVISPYQLNQKVAKEVYENILGIVENPENGNRTGTKRDKETIQALKKRLEEANEMLKTTEQMRENAEEEKRNLEKQIKKMEGRIEKADTVKEQLNAVMVQIKKVANGI